MRIPKQSDSAIREPSADRRVAFNDGVAAQLRVCTPCVRIGGGRWCVNLGPFGRRCFRVPGIGRWHACCRTRFGWPPVSCSLSRCG